jgi:biotin carboxyl carrier protein
LPLDIAVRHALLRIGAVAAASGISAVALFAVGRLIFTGDLGIRLPSTAQTSPPVLASATPNPVPSGIATPDPTPNATGEPSATPIPAPTTAPLALTGFRSGGRSYVGIVAPAANTTFAAPFAGTVEIRTYQFIDGEVRVGSNVATLPFFPYISVVAADRKITYRPGMLGAITEVLAADGKTVAAGDPLFRLVDFGRSSWSTFYNASAPYHVVVSLQALPSGRDLDPAPYLGGG